jgi:hypothetical protein
MDLDLLQSIEVPQEHRAVLTQQIVEMLLHCERHEGGVLRNNPTKLRQIVDAAKLFFARVSSNRGSSNHRTGVHGSGLRIKAFPSNAAARAAIKTAIAVRTTRLILPCSCSQFLSLQ